MSLMIPDYVVDLRRGIESDEIVPYFQPLLELRTGQLIGFEVLSRWKHPLRGMVPPDEFIRMAEDAGLIGQLMEKVLLHAFSTMRRLPEYLRLSINVSAIQLRDRTLRRQVCLAAEQAGFSLKRLTVEITESALVGNIEHARTITEELKALGVRIAIDDFGTGYSSLRHLHALPFDEIKVDRTFVQTMLSRRESRKIVAAIIGLGQSLGLTTVAEGVEGEAQADMLLWMGCDLGQGYLYGRPVSDKRLERFVLEQKKATRREVGRPPNSEDATFQMDALPSQRLSQLQAIYDGAPVGLCFLDRNERYVSVNKRLAEMNNAPIVSHLGRTVAEMIPEFYVFLGPYIKRAMNGEAFSGLVFRAARADGVVQVRSTSYQPTRDEAGEVVGVSVAVVDITERESAEVALRESEIHHRYAVELSPQVPWTADAQGQIIEASPQWTVLTGLGRDESMGMAWTKAVYPEDLVGARERWTHSIKTGELLDVEYRVRTTEGKLHWMRARAAPRRDDSGQIIRWYGTLEDIDDYKRAKEELREAVARLHGVFDAVPVGIVIAEAPSGRIVMGNPQAEAILRHRILETPDVTSHEEWVMFHLDGSRVATEDYPLVRAVVRGEASGAEEFLYLCGDGVKRRVSLTAAPILGQEGEIIGGVVTIQEGKD
ncbi:EAL domain-containing protein [Granulicella sp. dw_53]|uniref:EAL domain-containing protein n=1 Tax=Granulicella sp. dw_53 TaxID=2719792 RepID=UPI001BD40E3A|nr:EAL domain-containing protein [Granulicella sp. dw_53]